MMRRNVEVNLQALTDLSRQYKSYGGNVYSCYRTGSNRITRELESISHKYSKYSSVTSKVSNMQSKLREIERQMKEIEERSDRLSRGLKNTVASYKQDETQARQIINGQTIKLDKVSLSTRGTKVSIKLNNLNTEDIGKQEINESSVGEEIISCINGIGKKVSDTVSNITNQFTEVAQSVINYIKVHTDEVIGTLKQVGVKLLDGVQFALDIVGLVPVYGEAADILNAAIYTLRGDTLNAALSFAACIPVVGWTVTGGKVLGKVAKFINNTGDVSKLADTAKDLVKYVDKAKDIGKAALEYGDYAIDFIKRKGDDVWSVISNSKIVEKATEILGKLKKLDEKAQSVITNQLDKVTVSLGAWWDEQAKMYAVHPTISAMISANMKEELAEDINQHIVKESTEAIGDKLATEAVEIKVEKEIKEEVVEEVSEKVDNIAERVTQAEIVEGKKVVNNRVNNMIENMTEGEKSRTTYGAALVKLEDGTTEMWVSSAGKKGYVPPRIRGNDRVIKNKSLQANSINRFNDAEQTMMREANEVGAEIISIGATRDMCFACQTVANENGIIDRVVTPLKKIKK